MKLANFSFYLLLMAMIFAEFGSRFWFFDLFSHFVLQYWVLSLILFLFFSAKKSRRKTLVSATLCLWATVQLGSAVLDRAPKTVVVNRQAQLRIFEFNAEGNPEILNNWLPVHAAGYDVIVLLEATPDFQKLVEVLGKEFPYQALHLENSPFGIAVLSRWEMTQIKKFTFEGELYPQFQLQLKGPEAVGEFTLFAMHVPPPFTPHFEIAHKKLLTDLTDRLQQRKFPALVVGDLNTTSFSDRYQRLMKETGLSDTAGISPWAHSWPSHTINFLSLLGIRIDHCLVSTTFSLVNRERLEDLGSDHLPTKILLQFEK
jgi:endonuclease/exonuclease/phosphatase (EEP) superfamily protein YafD